MRQREEIQALLPQLTPWVPNQETLGGTFEVRYDRKQYRRSLSRILRTAMRARRDAGITCRLNELFADENVVNEQERITREMDSAGTDWSDEEWE